MRISKWFCCRYSNLIVFLIVSLLFSGCARPIPRVQFSTSPSLLGIDPRNVAVLVEADNNYDIRSIEDGIFVVLLNYGYTVSSRSDVKTLLKEINFQGSGLTDADASKIGKMLNVSTVLIAKGRSEGRDGKNISLRMIDVEKSEVLWLGTTQEYFGMYTWFDMGKNIAYALPHFINQPVDKPVYERSSAISDIDKNEISRISKLAILVKKNDRMKDQDIEDILMQHLMLYHYRIASRSDTDNALKEINFQNSGLTKIGSLKIGKMLNVPAVLIVEISDHNTHPRSNNGFIRLGLSARLIDIEKGNVLWVCNKNNLISYERSFTDADKNVYFKSLASLIASEFPKKDSL